MDTITHTLFGLSLYGAVDKQRMDKNSRKAYLLTAVGASQIPDIDVISRFWDTEGLYQMWHRGITHSVFLTPVWALLFLLLSFLLFRVKDKKLFLLGWLAVFIHNTSDLFNAWGTGYLEPFSTMRVTFGTIPIVDLVFWIIIGAAFFFTKRKKSKSPYYFKMAWAFMLLHVVIQSTQGYLIYKQYDDHYEQVALSAEFIPWTYSVITKKDNEVTIFNDTLFTEKKAQYVLQSKEAADLDKLFSERPEAKTLYEWSPFVVLVDDDERLGLYDPRFYRNGQSFLFEYIEKNTER
ncbi:MULTISPECIES: metal-dependent hydrolase [Cytobacillus]|uniref:Metal-dependent hydrolase n=1 Tax=Cytobacillus firmus TaxID=1399 RepID=A0AA46PEN4_CYTFI|nr:MULTISPECIES: metal-dependent hydrolase [Cytobacillus]MCC3645414.1 metal-dependent hydrolase [Cytobacillus oceanisediminis]MCS0651978.1 metal-dependent hydrolase [Cytobacillus firmus]MCU1804815.1 metal-dependent hydrolase [Cytobacillus firmus]UYG96693.1 metal-dependent hydrolase [Cytobacillus firmus]WHY35596.1 metal-dependent hydrolase [Cytobacillus firmus]